MGKHNIRKGILRSLCAAVTAFAAATVPVMGGTTFADTKDYDQEIAQLEQKAEQIKKDNEAREQQIGSLKSDVAENEQKMGLLQEQINGINDEVKTYGQLIAEGIDSAGENAGSASEKDGVLTIKTEADGSACTVTADSSTGDILTFRSPGNKLAVFFSDVSPYTEEVGVIE